MDQNKPKKYKLNCPESKYGFGLISENEDNSQKTDENSN